MRGRSGPGEIVDARRLASICGLTLHGVKVWQTEGCPVVTKGVQRKKSATFNTKDVIQWREDRAEQRGRNYRQGHSPTGKDAGAKANYYEERAENERLKRERAELELREYRGELLEGDEVERALVEIATRFRQGVLALPARLATDLHDCETIAEKRKAAEEICEELLRIISQSTVRLHERADAASARNRAAEGAAAAPADG